MNIDLQSPQMKLGPRYAVQSPVWANGVFSNAVPLGAQLKAPHVFRASCAVLKARSTCLRCFETGPQSTPNICRCFIEKKSHETLFQLAPYWSRSRRSCG